MNLFRRRRFKNVPKARWYPRWRLVELGSRDLAEIIAILMERNEILDDMPHSPFRRIS